MQSNMTSIGDSRSATPVMANNLSLSAASTQPQQESVEIQTPDGTPTIRVQKISSTAHFGVPLDLKKIALKCRLASFNPRRFGALVMRLRELQATGILFASGKLIVTEVDSMQKAELACKEFRKVIEKIGFKPKEFGAMDFKVKNILGTADCTFPLRLEELSYSHSDFVSYEPEVFPGLVYRLDRTEVVFLIFSSGKIVITGAKKQSTLASALTKLYPVLVEYKKKYMPMEFISASPSSSQVVVGQTTIARAMEEG
jgi:transcription initiation factor TFIID TATA-box-binding protein